MLAIADEFATCKFEDLRLRKRVEKLSEAIANHPTLSIHAACGSVTDSKAAYRFFQNDKVTPEFILKGHIDQATGRIADHDRVLVIHDTTDLIYTHFPSIDGVGERQRAKGFESGVKGIHLHNSLVLSESGVPLGLLKQSFFTHDDFRAHREENTKNQPGANKLLPFESKESYRWVDHLKYTDKIVKKTGAESVHVADRECDIYEFLQEAEEINAKFVVRSCSNRRTKEGQTTRETSTIQRHLDRANPLAEICVRKDKKDYMCEVKSVSVLLAKPQRHLSARSSELRPLKVNIVEVRSKGPSNKGPHWRLLTNLAIDSWEKVLRIIEIYRARWSIECFHRVLKSGFGVEKSRLATRSRLENMASVLSVVSWYIFWLYHFGRSFPSTSAEAVFDSDAIEILKISAKKLKVPLQGKFTIKKAIFILARLGGFAGRKRDGDPGMISIWRGWGKLQERMEFMEELTYG